MKLAKIKQGKSLLGALWYIMFEAKWVYKWTLNLAFYGGTLLFTFLTYVYVVNKRWFFACFFGFFMITFAIKAWRHYKLSRLKAYNETLGHLFEIYDK